MSRQEQLAKLQDYMQEVDKNITTMLQNLQWDRNELLKKPAMSLCKYDVNHKVPTTNLKEHEDRCLLRCNGYTDEDSLLPELLDINMHTVVKYTTHDVKMIINNAAENDPLFKKVMNALDSRDKKIFETIPPMTAERLQATYTADERRAIYDAAVGAVHAGRRAADFVLMSGNHGTEAPVRSRTRLEELAALRDRRRRRTKYRAPPKTRNYSDVLRDVISTQMEVLVEDQTHTQDEEHSNKKKNTEDLTSKYKRRDLHRHDTDACTEEKHVHRHRSSDTHMSGANKYDKTKQHDRDRVRRDYRREEKYEKHRDGTRSRNEERHSRDKAKKETERFSAESTSSIVTKRYHYTSEKTSYSDRERHSSNIYDRKRREGDRYTVSRHERDRHSNKRESECYKNRKDYKY